MDSDRRYIKELDKIDNRLLFLNRIGGLYSFYGSRDMAVAGSAKFNCEGIKDSICREKIKHIFVRGVRHSWTLGKAIGITQDPRVMLNIINILTERELDITKTVIVT